MAQSRITPELRVLLNAPGVREQLLGPPSPIVFYLNRPDVVARVGREHRLFHYVPEEELYSICLTAWLYGDHWVAFDHFLTAFESGNIRWSDDQAKGINNINAVHHRAVEHTFKFFDDTIPLDLKYQIIDSYYLKHLKVYSGKYNGLLLEFSHLVRY